MSLYEQHHNDPLWHAGSGAYGWGASPGAGGPPGRQGGGQPIDLSSYAQDDPRMVEAYGLLKGRMGEDNSKRAIDKAVMGTMDAAALGAKDLGANMARRGISGTGTGATFLNRNVFQPAQREAAGQAASISLAEQDRQDRLAQSLQGPAAGIAGQNLANRNFGLSTWQAQQQEALQRAQMEQQARESELARWMALTQSMGGIGSFLGQGGSAPALPPGPGANASLSGVSGVGGGGGNYSPWGGHL